MIVYATFVTDEDRYAAGARAWIALVAEESSEVIEVGEHDTIAGAYNEVLDELREDADVDAVVFVDQNANLAGSAGFGPSLRALLADDDIGLVRIKAAGDQQPQAFALASWGVQHMHCREDADADPLEEFANLAQLTGYQVVDMTVLAAD